MARRGIGAASLLLLAGCAGTDAPIETSAAIASASAPASDAATIGSMLDVTYRVTANRGEGGCQVPGSATPTEGACYEAELVLASDLALDLSDARIYFSQVEPVGQFAPETGASIQHVNGDLHYLELEDGAGVIGAGETFRLAFTVKGSALNRAKFMPNYYVVAGNGDVAVIDSTREQAAQAMGRKQLPFLAPLPENLQRAERDLTPIETPQLTFALNQHVSFVPEAIDSGILPTPAHVTAGQPGERIDLARGIAPHIGSGNEGALAAAFERLAMLGVARSPDGIPLTISVDEKLAIPSEGYELSLQPDQIDLRASDEAGAFYGLQSLAALIEPGRMDIPALEIEDAPRFGFRGMHIDIARNFHGPETIRALIDQMAAYKLNKLHLHLADDEGWRLEIDGLPELTGIGAKRCHDPSETRCLLPQLGSGPDTDTAGSGYLSGEDYIALLRYAADRHVEVIPALDMPGHARAAVKAMEARYARLKAKGASEEVASEFLLSDLTDRTRYRSIQHYSDNTINVCRPSAYRFVGHVLERLVALHRAANTPLQRYHIGADETAGAWKDSPLCQAFLHRADTPDTAEKLGGYFVARVARMVTDNGLVAGAWSDGLSHADPSDLPANIQSNVWGTLYWDGAETAHDHANRGWQVILSLPDALYFDFPYSAHPDEGGYYWAARAAPSRKLFGMMPENLPAMAAYWKDRDEQPFAVTAQPLQDGRVFAGIQGHIWSETVRDRESLGYQIFPRIFALAERAWHRADWEVEYSSDQHKVTYGDSIMDAERAQAMDADWQRFASILVAKELSKLEAGGWSYRLPTPGATWTGKRLELVSPLPGLPIECDSGAGWGSADQCKIAPGQTAKLRVTNSAATRHSREVEVTRPAK